MGSASLPSLIASLVKSTVGAGILSIPYCFGQLGLLLGVIVILVCAVVQVFALHLLALCVLQAQGQDKDLSFNSLARRAFGNSPVASILVSVSVIGVCFGCSVAYFIIIGDLLPEVVEYLGVDSSPWNSRMFWLVFVGWGVELPLSFLQNLDSLKFSSVIGNAGIMYMVIILCIFTAGSIVLPPPEQSVSVWTPPHSSHTSTPGMLQAVSIFLCAFGCAANVPAAVVELQQNTVRRVDAMIISTVAICSAIFIIVGVCGSYVFGASVEGNSLKSFPNEPATAGGLVSLFARVGVVMNVTGSVPLRLHPLREVISEMIFGKSPSSLSYSVHTCLTCVLFFSAWGLACVVESLDRVLALIGSTSDVSIGFLLPALFYYLGVGNQTEDSSGICLQDQRELHVPGKNGGGVSVGGAQFYQRKGPLRKAAFVLAVVCCVLIPVLLGSEIYKMLNGH